MGTMAEPCGCLSKYFVCIVSFLLFIAGSISVAVGLWVHYDKQSFSKFLTTVDDSVQFPGLSGFTHPDALTDVSLLLIISGGIICLVSFLGYCGSCYNCPCMTALFGCIILLILVLQIAAGGLAFFYKQRVGDEIKLFLKDTIRDYYNVTPTNQSNTATLMWNYLMAQLSCCGVDDYTDFSMSPRWNSTGLQVPAACCNLIGNKFDFQPLDPDCVHTATDANSYYRIGCYETVNNFVMGHLEIVFWVVLGLGTFELILMLLAFCLSKSESKYENSCC